MLFFLFKKSYIFWFFLFSKKFIINYEKSRKTNNINYENKLLSAKSKKNKHHLSLPPISPSYFSMHTSRLGLKLCGSNNTKWSMILQKWRSWNHKKIDNNVT